MRTFLPLPPATDWAIARPFVLGEVLRIPAPPALLEQILRAMRSATRDSPNGRTGSGPARSPSAGDTGEAPLYSSDADVLPEAQLTMEQLVQDHADAVYRVALSVTHDATMAEDVSQDVLIKAWQSLPSYRGEAPIRHWILRITHNMSVSMLRRRREDSVSPLDMPERPTSERSVAVQVEDRLAIARFEAALGDLDVVSRSIVVLREVEGLSYAEMSDVLELPLPTIRTRLLRARRHLAVALDGWQP